MPDLLEGFRVASSANVVLPGESTDEAVRRYVLSVCARSLRETAGYRTWLLEATKRYEAMRSTRSLDRDDPGTPWPRASNIGLPLEAITGEALIPRFNAATTDAEPMLRVQFFEHKIKVLQEETTNWFQDVLDRSMRVRCVRDETYRNLVIDGDGVEEALWEFRFQQTASTMAILQDGLGQPLRDAFGAPKVFQANLPEEAIPDDPLVPGQKLKKVLVQRKGTRLLYEGPALETWRLSECLWPEHATTPEIDELDWFGVQMWKSPSWFKTREGDPIQGNLKNTEQLLLRYKHGLPSHLDTDVERGLTSGVVFPKVPGKILLWKWTGRFDVDGDGVEEEILALVAPVERLLLGWRLSPFASRPYFHYQLFKMPGRFTGRGLPHLTRGMRDMMDFHLNQANNRASLYLNPPILYEIDSGFDPDIHQFGTGAKWGPLAPGGRSKVGALDLPKSQEQLALEFITFYMGLVQRLTGVNDFNLGNTQASLPSSVQTATGQTLLTQEGNIKFADFIKDFQDTFEREIEFLDREFFQEGLVTEENVQTISPLPVDLLALRMPKRFHATGNSQTMNRRALQEISLLIFDRFVADPVFQLDPALQRQLRQAVLDAFDVELQLPPPEQIQQVMKQQQVAAAAEALTQMPDEEKGRLLAGLMRSEMSVGSPTPEGVVAGNGNGTGRV